MFLEKRKHKRRAVRNCTAICRSRGRQNHGMVMNVSEGGMMIKADQVPAMHSEMEVFVTYESGATMTKRGVVVWLIKNSPPESGATFGLKFL